MDWLATAIALIAAGTSFWQASEARVARRGALTASLDSASHEAGALAALESLSQGASRTADATEGIDASGVRAADALAELATRQPPWEVAAVNARAGEWKLVNTSAHMVSTSKVVGLTDGDAEWFQGKDWIPNVPKEWTPHDWEPVTHAGTGMMVAPLQITILVCWKWAGEAIEAPDRRWKGTIG